MRIGNVSVRGRRARGRWTLGRPLGRQVQRRRITGRPVFNRITESLQLSAYRRSSRAAFVLDGFNTNIGFNIGFIARQIVFFLFLCFPSRRVLPGGQERLPSLFMPDSTHFRSRQARHWFRCVLSTGHAPSDFDLQIYCLLRLIDL